jgi:mRNA interferase RelE/StbE
MKKSTEVRFIDAAIEDLEGLTKKNLHLLRSLMKKFLYMERNPMVGEPLLGDLIGWRKIKVGDRHWRIIWRVITDSDGNQIIEVAEIWAIGARSDNEIYKEVRTRLKTLPKNQSTKSLEEVVVILSKVDSLGSDKKSTQEELPQWLVEKLSKILKLPIEKIQKMEPQKAISLWEAHISKLKK